MSDLPIETLGRRLCIYTLNGKTHDGESSFRNTLIPPCSGISIYRWIEVVRLIDASYF